MSVALRLFWSVVHSKMCIYIAALYMCVYDTGMKSFMEQYLPFMWYTYIAYFISRKGMVH